MGQKGSCHQRHHRPTDYTPSTVQAKDYQGHQPHRRRPNYTRTTNSCHQNCQNHSVEHFFCITARVSIVGISQADFLRSTRTRNIGQHHQHQLDGISSSGKRDRKVQAKDYRCHQSHQHHANPRLALPARLSESPGRTLLLHHGTSEYRLHRPGGLSPLDPHQQIAQHHQHQPDGILLLPITRKAKRKKSPSPPVGRPVLLVHSKLLPAPKRSSSSSG